MPSSARTCWSRSTATKRVRRRSPSYTFRCRGGYHVRSRAPFRQDELPFSPERGLARAFVGHASYTVDPRRTVVIEGAVRQSGKGLYVKSEYSAAFGQHWRLTFTGVGIGGDETDFLGQFRRNSHASVALRLSY